MKNKIVLKGIVKWSSGIVAVLLFVLINAMSAKAYTYGDLSYSINKGKVIITDCSDSASGEMIIPNEIDGYPVTSIGTRAFYGCSSLTSVAIPNGVTSIGDYAFTSCSSLTSVAIPEGVTKIGNYTFDGCSSLTSVTIPEGVTSIGASAFSGCSSLTSVTIPSSVTSIGYDAFYGCTAMKKVYIDDLAKWCQIYFASNASQPMYYGSELYLNEELLTDVTIPEGVTSIGDYAFRGCISLTSVSIPEGVTSIGDDAFYDCSGLTSVTIPSSVTSIGPGAFYGCTAMKKVYIDDLAKWCQIDFSYQGTQPMGYGSELYLNEELLTDVTIPEGVTSIGNAVFAGCSSLTSVSISEEVTSIGDYAFRGCISLTSVSIPEGVTSIGDYAFGGCSSLTSVAIPSSVTSIGYDAFYGCTALKKVYIDDLAKWCLIDFETSYSQPMKYGSELYLKEELLTDVIIPEGVTSIGDYAFYGCSSLTSVIIPGRVTSIASYAFYGCTALKKVWYSGSQDDKTNMDISNGNDNLTNAIWYYDVCLPNMHEYLHGCDSTCENCEWVRVTENNASDEHVFSPSDSLKCQYCRYTKAPSKPVITSHTDTIVILTPIENGEYSLDNTQWQTSNVFTNLLPNTEYTFYQRYAETDTHDASESSVGVSVTTDKSKQTLIPNAPIIESFTESSITLVAIEGCEYSKDGITWQSSNVFEGLSTETEYIFYQRMKETENTLVGTSSEGTTIYLKNMQVKPPTPILSSYTDESVVLVPIQGGEYSRDGVNWQSSNIFIDLLPNTKYTFFQRYAETDTHYASEISIGLSVTTDKSKQTLIPSAPTVQRVTTNSITLVPVEGCEYSKDGIKWQTSNVFSSLSCGTEYTFYQRYKETASTYVGKSSEGTIGKTDKGTQSAPSRPTLSSKTHNSVTLTAVSGYEYSMDGINWQTSNVFTGLNPETNYLFYQRKAENDRYYASTASYSLTVKTREMCQSIAMSTLPDKITYLEGKDKLELTGGKLSLFYSDGTTEIIEMTADMVSGFDNTVVGKQTLCLNYEGYTTTFTVEIVAKSVNSIEITKKPNKLTYSLGEGFNKSGMVVVAYYNNGTSAIISDYTISGDLSTKGNKTITVSYGGKITTLTVEVIETGQWKFDGSGWWYQNADGTYPASCWKEIDGIWYYFNASGYILTGWQTIGGTWYYFTGSGAMVTGWQSIGGTWYYFTGSGAMVTGWQQIDGTWYYFTGGGAMVTGWQSVGGTWYYFAGSGAMATGWQSVGGTWYYFAGSGAMLTGWQQIDGAWYYFEGSGAMVANRWVGNYYLQSDGSMATNKWIGSYYVGADGVWIP